MACFVKQGLPYNKPGEELTQLRRYNLVSVTGMQYLKRFVTTGIRCVVLIQSMATNHCMENPSMYDESHVMPTAGPAYYALLVSTGTDTCQGCTCIV